MKYFRKILKESFIIVALSSVIGLISGTFLSLNEEILYTIPIILLVLPSLNSLIGDISTVLVSRLTSHLYIGSLSPKIEKSERLKEDFLGLFVTILLSIVFLLVVGYSIGISTAISIFNPFIVILIILITIILLFFVMFIILFVSSILLFQRGKDPNNYLIPITTSLADFLTPFFIIVLMTIFI